MVQASECRDYRGGTTDMALPKEEQLWQRLQSMTTSTFVAAKHLKAPLKSGSVCFPLRTNHLFSVTSSSSCSLIYATDHGKLPAEL